MKILLILITIFISMPVLSNGATDWQLGFQEPASPVMQGVFDLHNFVLIMMTAITVFVLILLIYVSIRFRKKANPTPSKRTHNALLETLWTAIPVVILIFMAVPSFKLLYEQDVIPEADMTIKVIGHQWYWEYQYPEHDDLAFESYLTPEDELKEGEPRLLTVDNRLVLPVNKNIHVLVTAGDVLHSFAMPSLGVKKDAVPGRLNETWMRIDRPGIYRGQCSEICGSGHGYMPVVIEALSEDEFAAWVNEAKNEFAKLNNRTIALSK
ncbi:cytochrome c oxidase subunit II [Alphaproteobacteria bacterium]|nr:cytochrome c oxidase subunit II [Alphaproteobacteria bacterium]